MDNDFPKTERGLADLIRDRLADLIDTSSVKTSAGASLKLCLLDGQEYILGIVKTK